MLWCKKNIVFHKNTQNPDIHHKKVNKSYESTGQQVWGN